MQILLDHGANPNAQHPGDRCTPLIAASVHGHVGIVEMLLENGVNQNLIDAEGKAAFVLAGEVGEMEVVKVLIGGSPRRMGVLSTGQAGEMNQIENECENFDERVIT